MGYLVKIIITAVMVLSFTHCENYGVADVQGCDGLEGSYSAKGDLYWGVNLIEREYNVYIASSASNVLVKIEEQGGGGILCSQFKDAEKSRLTKISSETVVNRIGVQNEVGYFPNGISEILLDDPDGVCKASVLTVINSEPKHLFSVITSNTKKVDLNKLKISAEAEEATVVKSYADLKAECDGLALVEVEAEAEGNDNEKGKEKVEAEGNDNEKGKEE